MRLCLSLSLSLYLCLRPRPLRSHTRPTLTRVAPSLTPSALTPSALTLSALTPSALTLSALTLSALTLSALRPAAAAPPPADPTLQRLQEWAKAHEPTARWVVRAGGAGGGAVVGESTLSARFNERGEVVVTDRMRAQRTSEGAPLDLLIEREKVYQGTPPYALLEAYFYERSLGEARAGAWRAGRWVDLEAAPQVGLEGEGAPGQGVAAARAALGGGGGACARSHP